ELRNVVDRALALNPGAASFGDLKFQVGASAEADALSVRTDLPLKDAREAVNAAFERKYVRDLLERHGGNISAAARAAEVDRKHFRELARRHGLVGDAEE